MEFLFLANTHFPCEPLFYSSAHILQDAAALCAVSSKTFSFESKIFKDGRNNQFYCSYLPSTWSMYLLIEGFLWLFVFHIDPVETAYYWRF